MAKTTKILTIDDEEAVAKRIVDTLESNNYRAQSATKWTEAVDAIAHGQPDLVLLDLEMPLIHGAVLLEFIREEGYEMPVIAVSDVAEEDAAKALCDQGVQGIVKKPFEAQTLIEEIERVLDSTKPESRRAADTEETRENPEKPHAEPTDAQQSETPPRDPPPETDAPAVSEKASPPKDFLKQPRDLKIPPSRPKMSKRKKIALITIIIIYMLIGGFIAALYLTDEVPAFVDQMLRHW